MVNNDRRGKFLLSSRMDEWLDESIIRETMRPRFFPIEKAHRIDDHREPRRREDRVGGESIGASCSVCDHFLKAVNKKKKRERGRKRKREKWRGRFN